MFIEQIIEFEVRGPGPPCRTCTAITIGGKLMEIVSFVNH